MNHLKHLSIKSWHSKSIFVQPALHTLRTQVFSLNFLYKAFLISSTYYAISTIINEFAIYSNIFSQNFSFLLKSKITVLMFWNSLTVFGGISAILILAIALLVGVNVMLVIRKIAMLKSQKNVQWTFGAGIVSLASSSCPGCGFSLLSVTGLTSAIPGLPLTGITFSLVTLGILLLTTVYNLRSLGTVSCKIPTTN